MRHRILIAREQYKFSCAHMTVFPDGTKERLHGHNYSVGVALEVARIDLPAMIPFVQIKTLIGELCTAWKERVLVAERNPHLTGLRRGPDPVTGAAELEFRLCNERYVMPEADALLLPIDNISVEALAAHVADLLGARIALLSPEILALEVTISEHPGQGASCAIDLRSGDR